MTEAPDLSSAIKALPGARVTVIGDLMLDRFVYGQAERISSEAPVQVIGVEHEESMLGGAGNVVRNLVALGAEVCFVTVVGDDQIGRDLIEMVGEEATVEPYLLVECGRRSTTKVRYVANGQQLLRVDWEPRHTIDDASQARIIDIVTSELDDTDILILSDYAEGVLTDDILRTVISVARDAEVSVVVDPKSQDFSRYRGATVLTPNQRELSLAARMMTETNDEVTTAATTVMGKVGTDYMLVTRSADGMSLVGCEGDVAHFTALAQEVYDVSGAGDTVVATFAMALARGLPRETATLLANLAGGIVVGKTGTAVVDIDELHYAYHIQELSQNEIKVVSADKALEITKNWKSQGLKVGFTNGCFDLLHPGHVSLLRQARDHCDHLVVGLNSNRSVKALKGEERPIQNEPSRAQVLASLSDVDLVVVFDEDTPLALIERLMPDILVKGADYAIDEVVGAKEVQAHGGKVVLAELTEGHSTSAMVARISA